MENGGLAWINLMSLFTAAFVKRSNKNECIWDIIAKADLV